MHRRPNSTPLPGNRAVSHWRPFRERGFMVPVALALLVRCSALALSALDARTHSGSLSRHEAISVAASYAADSGAQIAMNRLLYPNPTKASANTICDAMTGLTVTFSAPGLVGCTALVACARRSGSGGQSFYNLSSRGTCASGEAESQRTIDVTTFML